MIGRRSASIFAAALMAAAFHCDRIISITVTKGGTDGAGFIGASV